MEEEQVIAGVDNPGIDTGISTTDAALLHSLAGLYSSGTNTQVVGFSNGQPSAVTGPVSNTTIVGTASGTTYSLTNTAALVDFGTTDPSITLNVAGTYLLMARARVDYNAATFAAVRTATLKLRRTNNTAADVTGTSSSFLTSIITLLSFTASTIILPPVIYTTALTSDIIQLWGSIDTVPSAGSIDITEANVVAIRLS